MRKYPILMYLVIGILSLISGRSFAEVPLLKYSDVPIVMQQLLELHVDHNQMTQELMQRSFHIYMKQFDPDKTYLLNSEVDEYDQASGDLLQQTLEDYYRGNYGEFLRMTQTFQKAALRAQEIRQEMEKDQKALLAESKNSSVLMNTEPSKKFADNESELKDRIRAQLVRFIALQELKPGASNVDELLPKIIALYEKNLQSQEAGYIFLNEEGEPFTSVQKEDFIALRITKSFAESLDAHTAFFSPMEAFDMKVRLEKGFYGLGIVLQEGLEGVTITHIIEGSPAQLSGLVHENDIIMEIDGQPINNVSFKKTLMLIKGKEGSDVVLGLKRIENKQEQYVSVTLKRNKVSLNEERVDISYESFGDGIIGKLVLHSFYQGDDISSEKDLRKALDELKGKGNLKGLILDIRDNTGGFLEQAVRVAGLFITNGVVVISKYTGDQTHYYRDVDGYSYFNGPMVVLTSRLSASAAEIVAQSLQDYGVALVVGEPETYGKGSIQHQTVTDGVAPSFFKVTVGRYYTVSGKSTQIKGVQADLEVPGIYHTIPIGEKYLEYPLQGGAVPSAYSDQLADIDPIVRHWFQKYYTPTLQKQVATWRNMLPQLAKNSSERINHNQKYQEFLKEVNVGEGGQAIIEELQQQGQPYERTDFQLDEATKIVQDMILLNKEVPADNVKIAHSRYSNYR